MRISDVTAFEVLDSRGTPTVECEVHLENDMVGAFVVPSGASTGKHEALELRDGDPKRFSGKGVAIAVKNVNTAIRDALIGADVADQARLDRILCELDGTSNKSRLGANAILAASCACAKAAAFASKRSLHEQLRASLAPEGGRGVLLPVPTFNVLNGGAHSDSGLDVQEYMIGPYGAPSAAEAVRWGVEVYTKLRGLLAERGHRISIGDEGGFAPQLERNEDGLELLQIAIERAGLEPGRDVTIVLDVAATEFYRNGRYKLKSSSDPKGVLDAPALVDMYSRWCARFPISGIEDGVAEDDWEGWAQLTRQLGGKVQLIGDDLFVTNEQRLKDGISKGVANAIIIKPNQIGTLTETAATIKLAKRSGYTPVMANRSAENNDSLILDLAVGLDVPQIKSGAPCRGERVSKYNQLIRLEQRSPGGMGYVGRAAFSRQE